MAQWLRFTHHNKPGFGQLSGDQIQVHSGDMFADSQATGETIPLAEVEIDIPCVP